MCPVVHTFFFFNDTATTEIYTLSLHDALPIFALVDTGLDIAPCRDAWDALFDGPLAGRKVTRIICTHRSEEHTSELQSRQYLVCRLLLEKKKKLILHPLMLTPFHSSFSSIRL